MQPPSELTILEATRLARVTLNATYKRIWQGSLPAHKVGRRWLIPREAAEHWRDQRIKAGRFK